MVLIKNRATSKPKIEQIMANQTLTPAKETAIMGENIDEILSKGDAQIIRPDSSGNGKDNGSNPVAYQVTPLPPEARRIPIVPRNRPKPRR